MPDDFQFDVFLSHRAEEKTVVRPLAEQLPKDGLNVWRVPPKPRGEVALDEWECPSPAGSGRGWPRPGEGRRAEADSILAKIKEGLSVL